MLKIKGKGNQKGYWYNLNSGIESGDVGTILEKKLIAYYLEGKPGNTLWMRTTVYDISLGSKKPRQVICTSRDMNYVD